MPSALSAAFAGLLFAQLAVAAASDSGIAPRNLAARIRALAEAREWRVLVHYRRNWLGFDRSEADGEGFFLSPTGRTDPEAELKATLAAFRAPVDAAHPLAVAAACRFPARFRFLREKLDPSLFSPPCPEFDAWKARFHPRALVVVYAAPYLGSPASMFGHTFLRIDSDRGSGMPIPPLDPSISFEAATPPGDGGATLAWKGLLGFYPGVFSLQPYHLKINLYSNLESRDLWEYELTLSPEEIGRLLDHAWELGSTYFDYYFFDENCSYQLLSLIEAARPELELRERFGIMTIPADTLRALARVPGLVRSRARRPSLLATLKARLKNMRPESVSRFLDLRGDLGLLGEHETADVLDALLDWEKYQAISESRTLLDTEHSVPPALLRARARAGDGSASSEAAAVPPDEGHPTSRLSGGGGSERGQGFARIELRPVLHDWLDPDEGYLPDSRLLIGQAAIEYQTGPNSAARLQELTLAEVATLSPWDALHKPLSWQVGGGFVRPEDTGCVSCVAGSFRAAGGIAGSPFDPILVYAMVRGDAEASPVFGSFLRVGPSGEGGALFSPEPWAKARLEIARTWFTGGVSYWRGSLETQFALSREVSIQASWERLFGGSQAVVDPARVTLGAGWAF